MEDFEKKYRSKKEIFNKEKELLRRSGGVNKQELEGIRVSAAKFFEELINYAVAINNLNTEDKKINLYQKIDLLHKKDKINKDLRDRYHSYREKRNSVMHPGTMMTRDICFQYLTEILEARDILAPYDSHFEKKHKVKSKAGTLEYAISKEEKLKYWLNPQSKHASAKNSQEHLTKHKDFWEFTLEQGFFYSHEVTDLYHDMEPKARANFLSRLSRDGWVYTKGEKSKIVSGSKKYYLNPEIIGDLGIFFNVIPTIQSEKKV